MFSWTNLLKNTNSRLDTKLNSSFKVDNSRSIIILPFYITALYLPLLGNNRYIKSIYRALFRVRVL